MDMIKYLIAVKRRNTHIMIEVSVCFGHFPKQTYTPTLCYAMVLAMQGLPTGGSAAGGAKTKTDGLHKANEAEIGPLRPPLLPPGGG